MSSDSGASGCMDVSPPYEIPGRAHIEQETEHDMTRSQLAMSLKDPGNQQLPVVCKRSLTQGTSVISSLSEKLLSSLQLRRDEQEHKNEDSTKYSGTSSPVDSPTAGYYGIQSGERNNASSPHSSDESVNLPTPQQAVETEGVINSEMVATQYYVSESLVSAYCLIQWRDETKHKDQLNDDADLALFPGDTAQFLPKNSDPQSESESKDATHLFDMDDDLPSGSDKTTDSPTTFSGSLSLTLANNIMSKHLNPDCDFNLSHAQTTPNPLEYIDRADQHRDPSDAAATVHSLREGKFSLLQ